MELPKIDMIVKFKDEHYVLDNLGTGHSNTLPAGTIGKIVCVDFEQSSYSDVVHCVIIVAYKEKPSDEVKFIKIDWSARQHNIDILPDTPATRVLYEPR